MARRDVVIGRRIFFRALLRGIGILWPALSGVLGALVGLGAIVGLIEDWGIAQEAVAELPTAIISTCGSDAVAA